MQGLVYVLLSFLYMLCVLQREVTVQQLVNVVLSVWITLRVPEQKRRLQEAVS